MGIPLLILETALSQYSSMGPAEVYANFAPLMQGMILETLGYESPWILF